MGFFALYCGIIYNDFASLRFDLFGTCYPLRENQVGTISKTVDCVYKFGKYK